MAGLPLPTRVRLWDRTLQAIRAHFRGAGSCEVSTPVRLDAVALEPFIEPIRCEGGVLATSPELPMKTLLASGSGPIFQVAPVFRAGESGARHREEFRLLEWYRLTQVGESHERVRSDVEAVVAAAFEAAAALGLAAPPPPRWEVHGWLDLLERTAGLRLRGDEDASTLAQAVQQHRPDLWVTPPAAAASMSEDATTLAAWTALFSTWSDAVLDPWLMARSPRGVHLVDFPPALAALSRLDAPQAATVCGTRVVAQRFESYLGGVELANGYHELTDAAEQRRRFEAVAELRRSLGLPELPWPRSLLNVMQDVGLPPCSGAALGLDRLVMLAAGADDLMSVRLM